MWEKIRKVYYSYLLGGGYYICLRVLAKFLGDEKAISYLYKKCMLADPDEYETILKFIYGSYTGRKLDLENPRTFNEKIQWLKLYDTLPIKTVLADKYSVREWIKGKIGEKYLIPLLGVWDRFEDIDFSKLPEQFVLKCTHGSGWNVIVTDKNQLEVSKVESWFNCWMKQNYAFGHGLELQYKNIAPRIIAEEYLKSIEGSLYDYKLFVFHGKVKIIQVDIDRFTNHCRNLYTPEWILIDGMMQYPSDPDADISRPDCLDELIRIAEILGKEFIHVRVDLYICNGHIYFGEMTFTHSSGTNTFSPKELEIQMGDWMKLPEIDENRRRYKFV